MEQRIAFLIGFSRGTMPIGIRVKTESEAEAARKILKTKGVRVQKLISVHVGDQKRG
jgi:hypothetical protein